MAKSSSTISATIFEAKTNLSALVKQAQKGKTVIITSGRDKKPVAKIEAIQPVEPKRLGVMETPGFELTGAFWEPLPEEELALWNGEGETFPE
jgi:antitoxin (DNA-binding transcriptional repressor) of toxin-antitoxin stability system